MKPLQKYIVFKEGIHYGNSLTSILGGQLGNLIGMVKKQEKDLAQTPSCYYDLFQVYFSSQSYLDAFNLGLQKLSTIKLYQEFGNHSIGGTLWGSKRVFRIDTFRSKLVFLDAF